jgi:hypothetical protein
LDGSSAVALVPSFTAKRGSVGVVAKAKTCGEGCSAQFAGFARAGLCTKGRDLLAKMERGYKLAVFTGKIEVLRKPAEASGYLPRLQTLESHVSLRL